MADDPVPPAQLPGLSKEWATVIAAVVAALSALAAAFAGWGINVQLAKQVAIPVSATEALLEKRREFYPELHQLLGGTLAAVREEVAQDDPDDEQVRGSLVAFLTKWDEESPRYSIYFGERLSSATSNLRAVTRQVLADRRGPGHVLKRQFDIESTNYWANRRGQGIDRSLAEADSWFHNIRKSEHSVRLELGTQQADLMLQAESLSEYNASRTGAFWIFIFIGCAVVGGLVLWNVLVWTSFGRQPERSDDLNAVPVPR